MARERLHLRLHLDVAEVVPAHASDPAGVEGAGDVVAADLVQVVHGAEASDEASGAAAGHIAAQAAVASGAESRADPTRAPAAVLVAAASVVGPGTA